MVVVRGDIIFKTDFELEFKMSAKAFASLTREEKIELIAECLHWSETADSSELDRIEIHNYEEI